MDNGFGPMPCSCNSAGFGGVMENPSLVLAISKLAADGERAGFSLEQMIDLLDAGLEVETLLELICWRLRGVPLPRVTSVQSS